MEVSALHTLARAVLVPPSACGLSASHHHDADRRCTSVAAGQHPRLSGRVRKEARDPFPAPSATPRHRDNKSRLVVTAYALTSNIPELAAMAMAAAAVVPMCWLYVRHAQRGSNGDPASDEEVSTSRQFTGPAPSTKTGNASFTNQSSSRASSSVRATGQGSASTLIWEDEAALRESRTGEEYLWKPLDADRGVALGEDMSILNEEHVHAAGLEGSDDAASPAGSSVGTSRRQIIEDDEESGRQQAKVLESMSGDPLASTSSGSSTSARKALEAEPGNQWATELSTDQQQPFSESRSFGAESPSTAGRGSSIDAHQQSEQVDEQVIDAASESTGDSHKDLPHVNGTRSKQEHSVPCDMPLPNGKGTEPVNGVNGAPTFVNGQSESARAPNLEDLQQVVQNLEAMLAAKPATRTRETQAAGDETSHQEVPAVDSAGKGLKEWMREYNDLLEQRRLQRAVGVLEEMQRLGILNSKKVHHGSFFHECKRQRDVRSAFRFAKLISSPSLSTFNLLLSVCSATSDGTAAMKAFKMAEKAGLRPDCALYTNLISAYCKAGKVDVAFKVYHEMEAAGVEPSVFTYGALIDGCGRAKQVAKAFGVYGIMLNKGMKPDTPIFNALISACGRSGSLERAFDMLADMRDVGLEPNHVTLGAILDACSKNDQMERAVEVYAMMKAKGVAITMQGYTAAVQACKKQGNIEQALQMYHDMKAAKVTPDEGVFSELMEVASKAQRHDVAFELLADMRQMGVPAGFCVYSVVMRACSQAKLPGKALEILQQMQEEGVRPTIGIYNSLVKTLCDAKQLPEALRIVEAMKEGGTDMCKSTYAILLHACEQVQDAGLAMKLYHTAQMEGVHPNLGMCDSMITICYDQIKKGTPANHFAFTVAQFLPDRSPATTLGQPHRHWAGCALAVYRETLAGGEIPTPLVLSKLLGCMRVSDAVLHRPHLEEALTSYNSPAGGQQAWGAGTGAGARAGVGAGAGLDLFGHHVHTDPDEIYEARALAIYEEAAELGVVPKIGPPAGPLFLDLTALPVHAAEVGVLALLKGLKLRQTAVPGSKPHSLTLQVAVEKMDIKLNRKGKLKEVTLASKTGQAVAALLRRLGVRFSGHESRGKLRITTADLAKWLKPQYSAAALQPVEVPSYRQLDPGSMQARLARNIAMQQRAIRFGGVGDPYSSPSSAPAGARPGPPLGGPMSAPKPVYSNRTPHVLTKRTPQAVGGGKAGGAADVPPDNWFSPGFGYDSGLD